MSMNPFRKQPNVETTKVTDAGFTPAVVTEEGKIASNKEHEQSLREALKGQWKAVCWSLVLSLSIVMLIGNFFGYTSFQKKYGSYYPGIGYQLSAPWQVGLKNAATCGIIVGATTNGYFSARYGYKLVMQVSLVMMTFFLFIPFFANNIQVLTVGEVLCGLCWGCFTTIGPAYSSEVCPIVLRGYLTSYVNVCMVVGQLISIGVLDGLENLTTQWSYRIPFAIQWIWPVPIFAATLFAPESPWWLVRKGRLEAAERCVQRLSAKTFEEAKETVAMMIHTANYETEVQSGTSYLDCFRGSNFQRTEVSCLAFVGQVTCGISMMDPGTYFWEQAGLSASNSYKVSVGATAIGLLATIVGSFLIAIWGRRKLYVGGMFILTVICLLIGILSAVSTSQATEWLQVAFTILWVLVYDLSLGPAAYATSSEISAVSLRVKTVCLAKIVHQLADIVSAILEPYMINPTSWNWKGKTAFFWAGTSLVTTVWAYYRYPETHRRSYEELDILFVKGVSARKFQSYKVDAYAEDATLLEKNP